MKPRIIRSVTLACFLALAMLALTLGDVSASTASEGVGPTAAGASLPSIMGSGQALPLQLSAPDLIAAKVVEAGDSDGDGDIEPGDVLTYTIAITNVGSAVANDVTFNDTIDVNTKLVGNSEWEKPVFLLER
jgi:uncharacterized repeat protein (TIGR01451 family)